jgi:nicotinate phosphoribosyltransferase
MLDAALHDGTAARPSVFEVFARRLPPVVATASSPASHASSRRSTRSGSTTRCCAGSSPSASSPETLRWLADFRFSGDVHAYREGEVHVDGSPVMTVVAPFGEALLIETLVLSILNHDSAIAAAAARMVGAPRRPPAARVRLAPHPRGGRRRRRARRLRSSGSTRRRTSRPDAATASRPPGRPGTRSCSCTTTSRPRSPRSSRRPGVDDAARRHLRHSTGIATPSTSPGRSSARSASTPATSPPGRAVPGRCSTRRVPPLTRIVVSGDLDEHAIARLADAPVDAYGVGTSLVTGSGAPTAGFVYKLVARATPPVGARAGREGWRGEGDRRALEGRLARAPRRCRDARAAAPRRDPASRRQPRAAGPGDRARRAGGRRRPRHARAHHRTAIAELPPGAHDLDPGRPASRPCTSTPDREDDLTTDRRA